MSLVHENSKLKTSQEHVVYINRSECQNKKTFVYATCSWSSELGIFMYWTICCCGLVDAKIRASDKDLSVQIEFFLLRFRLPS